MSQNAYEKYEYYGQNYGYAPSPKSNYNNYFKKSESESQYQSLNSIPVQYPPNPHNNRNPPSEQNYQHNHGNHNQHSQATLGKNYSDYIKSMSPRYKHNNSGEIQAPAPQQSNYGNQGGGNSGGADRGAAPPQAPPYTSSYTLGNNNNKNINRQPIHDQASRTNNNPNKQQYNIISSSSRTANQSYGNQEYLNSPVQNRHGSMNSNYFSPHNLGSPGVTIASHNVFNSGNKANQTSMIINNNSGGDGLGQGQSNEAPINIGANNNNNNLSQNNSNSNLNSGQQSNSAYFLSNYVNLISQSPSTQNNSSQDYSMGPQLKNQQQGQNQHHNSSYTYVNSNQTGGAGGVQHIASQRSSEIQQRNPTYNNFIQHTPSNNANHKSGMENDIKNNHNTLNKLGPGSPQVAEPYLFSGNPTSNKNLHMEQPGKHDYSPIDRHNSLNPSQKIGLSKGDNYDAPAAPREEIGKLSNFHDSKKSKVNEYLPSQNSQEKTRKIKLNNERIKSAGNMNFKSRNQGTSPQNLANTVFSQAKHDRYENSPSNVFNSNSNQMVSHMHNNSGSQSINNNNNNYNNSSSNNNNNNNNFNNQYNHNASNNSFSNQSITDKDSNSSQIRNKIPANDSTRKSNRIFDDTPFIPHQKISLEIPEPQIQKEDIRLSNAAMGSHSLDPKNIPSSHQQAGRMAENNEMVRRNQDLQKTDSNSSLNKNHNPAINTNNADSSKTQKLSPARNQPAKRQDEKKPSVEPKNFQDQYQQYKKLQEKLNFLENKIMTIKSNIDSNYKEPNKNESLNNQKSSNSTQELNNQKQISSTNTNSQRNFSASLNSPNPNDSEMIKQQENAKSQRDSHQNINLNDQSNQLKKPPLSNAGFMTPQANISLNPSLFANRNAISGTQLQNTHNSPPQFQSAAPSAPAAPLKEPNNQRGDDNHDNQNSLSAFVTQVKLNSPLPINNIPNNNSNSSPQYVKKSPLEEERQSVNPSQKQSSMSQSPQQASINLSRSDQDINQSVNGFDDYGITKSNQQQGGSQLAGYFVSAIARSFYNKMKDTAYAQLCKDHLHQCIQALSFVQTLNQPTNRAIQQKKIELKKHEKYMDKQTIVFDLDETLIHCNQSLTLPSDVILPITFPNGDIIQAGINIRSYCIECLQELSQYYEIIVFTASHSCYANVVLDYLDPQQRLVQHRLFRQNCVATQSGVYVKDLRVIANRNMSDMLLVDNAAYSFGFQIENGIPIIPFYDNKSDMELKSLTSYLKNIYNHKDLRDINSRTFKMHQYADFNDAYQLLDKLYNDEIKLI